MIVISTWIDKGGGAGQCMGHSGRQPVADGKCRRTDIVPQYAIQLRRAGDRASLERDGIVGKEGVGEDRPSIKAIAPDDDSRADAWLGGDKGVMIPQHSRGGLASWRPFAQVDVSTVGRAFITGQEVVG